MNILNSLIFYQNVKKEKELWSNFDLKCLLRQMLRNSHRDVSIENGKKKKFRDK